jgi:hypothetical protein
MKKIYFYLAAPAALLLLFFVLVYKTDTKKNNGTVSISIALDKDNLSNEQKDSLVTELLDLYEGMGTNTYHAVEITIRGNEEKKIVVPKSGLNGIRSAFSSSFYTYDNRLIDIQNFKSKYKEKAETYRKNIDYKGNVNEKNAEIIYFGNTESPSSEDANSIAMLKSRIKDCLKSRKVNKIIISTLENEGTAGIGEVPKPTPPLETEPKPGSTTLIEKPKETEEEPEDKPAPLSETKINFALDGNINVFSFSNAVSGATYYYEIVCESNCGDDPYKLSGSTERSELRLDLHNEYEAIKLRTFRITVTTRIGNQTKTNSKSGVKLKCKK